MVVVSNYRDLISDDSLNVARADAVARELASGHEFAARVPTWLIDDKSIHASDYNEEIVAGSIVEEREKAFHIEQDDTRAWLPKSMIHVYEVDEDADLDALETSAGSWDAE